MRRFKALKEQANGFNDFLTPVGENIIKARIEKSINCQSIQILEQMFVQFMMKVKTRIMR
jgi:hypothetical protein